MPAYTEDTRDRLRAVEENVTEIKVSTALQTQTLEGLVEQVKTGFTALNVRLDEGTARFEANEKEISEAQGEIKKIKAVEVARSARWKVARKAVLPLLAAAAGVIATKGGEALWIWFSGLVVR